MRRWWVVGLLGLCSCASIMSQGGQQSIAVNSQPPGADVVVNDTHLGVTPLHVKLDRRQEYTVRLRKAGYEPYEQRLAKQVDPLFFVNLVFLPGFVVDIATGSWQQFPGQVQGPLTPTDTPHAARGRR